MIILLVATAVLFEGVRFWKFFSTSRRSENARITLFLASDILVLFLIVMQLISPNFGRMPLEGPAISILYWVGLVLALSGSIFSSWSRLYMGKSWRTGWNPEVTHLVRSGPYALMRHPIYLGTWLFGVGFELALSNWLVVGALAAAPILVYAALREERELQKIFTDTWEDYALRTARFIPYVY